MKDIRCENCNRLLARATFITYEIKCARCGHTNLRAKSPTIKRSSHVNPTTKDVR
ncbi:MAG: Com family DNA-binding transcriptional regulator [Oceanospirillaceae bacterium]|nr:Com family DNA-binding transcriptional regulator [Oceanospirillaceae bacterium]